MTEAPSVGPRIRGIPPLKRVALPLRLGDNASLTAPRARSCPGGFSGDASQFDDRNTTRSPQS